jgi:3(or 17)beta-hydroxysteroid dehydrogenase
MGRVQGKIAIITGAAKGLGEADARALAREGATVIMTDVDSRRGEQVAAEIGATFKSQDVTQEDTWPALIEEVVATHGGLHILVNNAGIVEPGTIITQTAEQWRRQMAVSADATFFGCKYAVPAIAASGGGSIVNMASVASKRGYHTVTAYCAAKAAVEGLTRAVAAYCLHEKNDVRCNSIHPGSIDTPMVANVGKQMADTGMVRNTPPTEALAPVLGEPDDIANLVLYLASDESKFINGQEFIADKGLTTLPADFPR